MKESRLVLIICFDFFMQNAQLNILYYTVQHKWSMFFWWSHRTESNTGATFCNLFLVITHSQVLEEGTQVSYPIYVIDNNPPALFTVYLTACQFIKIYIYSTFKYCQQRSNYNDLFLLNESSPPSCIIENYHNLL